MESNRKECFKNLIFLPTTSQNGKKKEHKLKKYKTFEMDSCW